MIVNWNNGVLNRTTVLPVASTLTLWPAGYIIGTGGVTQAGIAVLGTTGETTLTQFGVVPLSLTGDVRVTQVGIVVMWRSVPIVCVGELEGGRTDGLPYVPYTPDPCEGSGTLSSPRIGD